MRNINSNIIFNNNINQRGNKKTKNNFILNKIYNKYNINYKVENQESISHLSTTSGGDYNYYNKSNYKDFNEDNQNNKKENLIESIKKGIKDIKDCFNSNQKNSISLACYYYCNLNLNVNEKINFENMINK